MKNDKKTIENESVLQLTELTIKTLSKIYTKLLKVVQLKLGLVHAEYPFLKAMYGPDKNGSGFLILKLDLNQF